MKTKLERSKAFATVFLVVGLSCSDPVEPFGDVLGSDVALYSQLNEELIIRDFFEDMRGGVFLDVGCSTPISNSTTYYLEKHLGWTGIGVDALSEFARAWAETRPNSDFFSYAVTDTSGETVTFYRAAIVGLSSLSEEAAGSWGASSRPIEVPTITLTKLLDDNGITKLDFLSMDIEGAEEDALAGFDIDRFKPELICIEVDLDDEDARPILSYLKEHGYERIDKYEVYDHVNSYYRRVSGS